MVLGASQVNTNAYAFEEIATSLATLTGFMAGGRDAMTAILDEFQHLYRHALQQPPNYREVTELAGHGLKACDGRASRAAWLLMNVQQLNVSAVHSLVCHKVGGRYAAPILDQVGSALGLVSQLSSEQLQEVGLTNFLLDVLGTKDGEVWLVQTVFDKDIVRSAVKNQKQRSLFERQSIFRAPVIGGAQVTAITGVCR